MFPGQGSQVVGMGKDLYDKYPKAKEIIDLSGDELKDIIFNGPEETLKLTQYTQPAIFTVSVAAFEVLKETIDLSKYELVVAGHSLGEYSALCAAGFFSFKEGIELVKARGAFIQEASQQNPGSMAAILGLEKQVLIDICKEASSIGVCEPVNFNSPGQIVVAGQIEALNKVIELAKKNGAKKSIMLNVSGPFHSSLMKLAADKMAEELNKYTFKTPSFGVFTNCDATLTKDPTSIKEKLVKQISSAVKWDDSMNNIIKDGFYKFIELGPGKVLSGLLKRIDKSKIALNIEGNSGIEALKLFLALE
jgi:[acyl-carrier-protein] S-malonyltransferase